MIKGYAWELRANYGYGWDMVTTEPSLALAREQERTYRLNDPSANYKIVRVREGESK